MPALEVVLEDAFKEGVDEFLCLGDVANFGPNPAEVLERMQTLNCPMIMGNKDHALFDDSKITTPTSKETQFFFDVEQWCSKQLSQPQKDYIKTFQPTLRLERNKSNLVAYHGSPLNYHDQITALTPDETLLHYLQEPADLYAGGHTHEQFSRRFAEARLTNPGSVGISYFKRRNTDNFVNPARAEYAILDFSSSQPSILF